MIEEIGRNFYMIEVPLPQNPRNTGTFKGENRRVKKPPLIKMVRQCYKDDGEDPKYCCKF